jgi:hypothetical protein
VVENRGCDKESTVSPIVAHAPAAVNQPRPFVLTRFDVTQHCLELTLVDRRSDVCRRIQPVADDERCGSRGQPIAKRIAITIGLLCSKTFTYDGMYEGMLAEEYGIPLDSINKVNIKGKFIVWHGEDDTRVDIPLKDTHKHTRPGCTTCPDFAAQHADISTGGLGQGDGWTLTLVRTQRGLEWMEGLRDAGLIEVRPGTDDPAALNLMDKLALASRKRWPATRLGMTDGAAAPGRATLPVPLPMPEVRPAT